MVFLIQRQQVALKIEGAEGTAETLGDSEAIAPVFDVEYAPTIEVPERAVVQDSLSRLPRVAGQRSAVIRFATELKGSGVAGTAPPNLSAALQAAGFSEAISASVSVTYEPDSSAVPSATVGIKEMHLDGTAKYKTIVGARGTVVFEATKGNIVLARFEFTGRYVEPTESTAWAQPAPGTAPEPFLNAAFEFQTETTLKLQGVTLDIGNMVSLRNDVNEAAGHFSAVIVGRTPVGSIDPEQEKIATVNFFNNLTTNVEGKLEYVLGATAGNIATVTADKAQIVGASEADRDGIRILSLDLQLNQNATAGDDELSIVFT